MDFPGGSMVKNPSTNAGDASSVPGSGRSGEGNSNPFQYSCLGNPWTEELAGYGSWICKRIRLDWVTK